MGLAGIRSASTRIPVGLALFLCLFGSPSSARTPEEPEGEPEPAPQDTFLDHTDRGPYWFSAQINVISQGKPEMPALYSGTNSFTTKPAIATSGVGTAFFAYRPTATTEFILDAEVSVGSGLSGSVGIAGFPNLDVVRSPGISVLPYIARMQIHQLVPLTNTWEENDDRGPLNTFVRRPRHRLDLRFGKMATVDYFDVNPAASDSHLQFMNWAVDNTGAYDYAADTRGYTYGLIIAYQGPVFEARFGEMLMPTVANGENLSFNLTQSRGENFELEWKYEPSPGFAGVTRLLAYWNHADMGNYRESIDDFLAGQGTTPDITATRHQGNSKYGFALNLVQELFGVARLFTRVGWNDGRNESFAYTEIDDTLLIGGDVLGTSWGRRSDRIGLACATNGLSSSHREYLQLGGLGFILGDGALTYGREVIVEAYYNAHIWRGAFAAGDIQFVQNPGYNQVRGPAWVFSLRVHLEF